MDIEDLTEGEIHVLLASAVSIPDLGAMMSVIAPSASGASFISSNEFSFTLSAASIAIILVRMESLMVSAILWAKCFYSKQYK